jgi:hypothetical protein
MTAIVELTPDEVRQADLTTHPSIIEVAVEIARDRQAKTERLYKALVRHDDLAALDVARELCGLTTGGH